MFTLADDQVPENPVTRFAPSVTGWLHVGHVAHAVFVWGVARAFGAKIILRLEDHDRTRFRPEYDAAILEDLEWLGLEPDDVEGTVHRQSDRADVYQAQLDQLSLRHHVYACDCTRAILAEKNAAKPGSSVTYPGRCRYRQLSRTAGHGVRVIVEAGEEHFTDLVLGEQRQSASGDGGGDPLLANRVGNWSYHFAVVVDDYQQGVNLVIRGEDLLFTTARQIRLARMLGRETAPVFLHHPLVRDERGNKLSKREGALGVRELRAGGMSPEEMLGLAAYRVGLLDVPASLEVSQLADLFV